MTPARPLAATNRALAADRHDARVAQRGLTTAGALLGVAPFTHAIAPHCAPALVHAVTAIWAATMLACVAAHIEAYLFARKRPD